MLRTKTMILALLLLILLTACGDTSTSSSSDDEKLDIYTTIYPIQYMVERIGGDMIQAETVYPPGTDAHSYEPTSKMMTSIARADAFIYLGANLEAIAETAANALESEDVTLIELGTNEHLFDSLDAIDGDMDDEQIHEEDEHANHEHSHEEDEDVHESVEHSHDDGHNHGDLDPHIWLDPIRAIDMALLIKNELITLLPNEEDQLEENFNKLESDLLQLNEQFTKTLENKQQKRILVSHAAYGYWEQRYGIEQIAVNGLTSNSEPSQKELIAIIEQAEQYNLKYMIFEQNVSETVSKRIQEEIGATPLTIHNLSVRTEADINNNEDYLSLMKQNIKTLNQATTTE